MGWFAYERTTAAWPLSLGIGQSWKGQSLRGPRSPKMSRHQIQTRKCSITMRRDDPSVQVCVAQRGNHEPHVAFQHLKCGQS